MASSDDHVGVQLQPSTTALGYRGATKELIQAIYSKVQTGSRELEQRLRQLDRLVETIRAIAKNSLFHTPSIKSHLKAIEPHVESLRIIFGRLRQKKLQTTIGRKLWNAYTEIRAEKQICIIFTKLEEEKSALQLSMSEVSATLLSQVENGVNAIKDGSAQAHDKQEPIHPVDTSQETLWQWPFESHSPTKLDGSQKTGLQGPDEVPIPMEIDFSPETRPQWSNEAPRAMKPQEMKLQKSACPRASTATTEGSFNNATMASSVTSLARDLPTPSSGTSSSSHTSSLASYPQRGHIYEDNTSDGQQLNGDVEPSSLRQHQYRRNKVTSKGGQMNGNASSEFTVQFLQKN